MEQKRVKKELFNNSILLNILYHHIAEIEARASYEVCCGTGVFWNELCTKNLENIDILMERFNSYDRIFLKDL